MIFLGLLAASLAAGCLWAMAWMAVDRRLAGYDLPVRLVAGACGFYWAAAWLFEILALAGAFRREVAFLLLVVLPLLGLLRWHRTVGEALARAGAELGAEARALATELLEHRWVAVGLGLVGVHVLLRAARTLATPAFGVDDFTYHLFRAGRWVQNSGIVLEPAPDAWTYYEFFPWGGDLVWAWALVWRVGDGLVPVASLGLWLLVPLAGYAVGRELGQGRSTAAIVAVAISVLPSQISQIATAYVDNGVLAMLLATALFLLVYLRREPPEAAALLVGASCGLGLLIKVSFLPIVGITGLVVLVQALKRRRVEDLVLLAAGLTVALPNLLFNWLQRGSPFYPFEIVGFLPHNEQHSWILSKYGEGLTAPELYRAAKALLFNLSPADPFLNVGFLGLLLLLLGLAGARGMLFRGMMSRDIVSSDIPRTERGRWYVLWALAVAAITIWSFFSPKNSSMFGWWILVMGRFLVVGAAGLMVLAGQVGGRLVRALVVPVMLAEYAIHSRRSWPTEMVAATLQILLLLLALMGLWLLLRRIRARPGVALVAGLTACVVALSATTWVRESWRWEAYRLFSERRLDDFSEAPATSLWPVWREIERHGPARLAVTAGFDGLTGHNWHRWPFLGRELQNDVVYLPITGDGTVVSYRDPDALDGVADREAWLRRVLEEDVEWVVALGPRSIEHQWLVELPEIFSLAVSNADGTVLAAHVERSTLAEFLASEP